MSKMAKATIGLMVVTILSKVLGFCRELILGATYGATLYSDAYITAMNIPTVLFEAVGVAIATTYIPLYYENKNIGGEKGGLNFTNNVLNIVFLISVLIAILGVIFVEPLVKLFAIGFEGETFNLAVKFTKIMIWGILFIGIGNIMTSVLQIKEMFMIPGLVGIPFNIIIIISTILSFKINIYILPIGTLIAVISKFIFQLYFAYKNGYEYKFNINIKNEYIKKIIWLVGPVFIGVAVNQINTIVDRTLASTLIEGSISALNYANRLNGFVTGLFIISIGSVIYPILSNLSSQNNKEKFLGTIVNSINSVILLVIPVSVGAIVLANPIVKILFERGAFNENATSMTATALIFYSIGMVAFGLRDILGKIFYSLQDTKTPMVNGAIAMVINIFMNIALINIMGYAGLAFATSISSIICIVLLFISLKNKIGYFGQDKILNTMVKSLISAVVMGIATVGVYKLLVSILGIGVIPDIISLFGSISIGAIVYSVMVIILKIEEVNIVIEMIKRKLHRKSKNMKII